MLKHHPLRKTPHRQRVTLIRIAYGNLPFKRKSSNSEPNDQHPLPIHERIVKFLSGFLVRKKMTSPLDDDFGKKLIQHFHEAKRAAIARQHQLED